MVAMAFLSEQDKKRLSDAIRLAETKTSGELVTVITRASDEYLYIPLLWASLVALLLPGIFILFRIDYGITTIYEIQVISFLVLVALFYFSPVKMWLIPKDVKHRRANRLAHTQFYIQNVHNTAHKNGILLFVSVAERHVEIIADKGINDVVDPGAWDRIIREFVKFVKRDQITDGFLYAIEACGNILAKHYPSTKNNIEELPNRLIEI